MEIPFTVITNTVQETEQIGSTLADTLLENSRLPRFIALYGDLGVGKTAFVRGFTQKIAPRTGVRSPTFTLVNEYRGGIIPVFHFDMYRITGEDDLYSIGFDDYLATNAFCLAEWCENIPFAVQDRHLSVIIRKSDSARPDQRFIEITVHPDGKGDAGTC